MSSSEEEIRSGYIYYILDAFKDMYGMRPRHINFNKMSVGELEKMADAIEQEYQSFDFGKMYGPEGEEFPRKVEAPVPSDEELALIAQRASDAELGQDTEYDLMPKHVGMGKMGESMKITESELKALIRESIAKKLALKEASGEPGTNVPNGKAVADFVMEFKAHINKMVEDTKSLADKGEKLIETNLLNHPEVGTRNELLIQHVGMLRSIANSLATVFERIRRFG